MTLNLILDANLVQFKEIDELYKEIMALLGANQVEYLDDTNYGQFVPAAPNDLLATISYAFQGLERPPTLQTPKSKYLLEVTENGLTEPESAFEILTQAVKENQNLDYMASRPTTEIANNLKAQKRTLRNRYTGKGYQTAEQVKRVDRKVAISVGDYVKYLKSRACDFLSNILVPFEEAVEPKTRVQQTAVATAINDEEIESESTDSSVMDDQEIDLSVLKERGKEFEQGMWGVSEDVSRATSQASTRPAQSPSPTIPEEAQPVNASVPATPSTASTVETPAMKQQPPASPQNLRLPSNSTAPTLSKPLSAPQTPEFLSLTKSPTPASEQPTPKRVHTKEGEHPRRKQKAMQFNQELQERLEDIWDRLEMPVEVKMDMAIKYSGITFASKLRNVLGTWETVTELIMQREAMLPELEEFERSCVDPSRLFRDNAQRREAESVQRELLLVRLRKLEKDISRVIGVIQKSFGDVVLYKGGSYVDKMSHDYSRIQYQVMHEYRNGNNDDPQQVRPSQAVKQTISNLTLETSVAGSSVVMSKAKLRPLVHRK
jgi:hypothetical protein